MDMDTDANMKMDINIQRFGCQEYCILVVTFKQPICDLLLGFTLFGPIPEVLISYQDIIHHGYQTKCPTMPILLLT
jgi:hypothetical protein